MNHKDLIKQTAEAVGVPYEVAEANNRALFEAMRRSIGRFEPIKVTGILDINLHKYIFADKIQGKELIMPEGIAKVMQGKKEGAHNAARHIGTFVKYESEGVYIGLVHKKVGDNEILVYPLIRFEHYYFGKYKRYKMYMLPKEPQKLLKKEQYGSRGTVKKWLGQIEGKIDPIISTKSIFYKLYRQKQQLQFLNTRRSCGSGN